MKNIAATILLLCLLSPVACFSQILQFVIPETMILQDTSHSKESILWDYVDSNGMDNMQIHDYGSGKYFVYFKNSTNETFSAYFDTLDRMTYSGYRKDLTATGYELDSNQRVVEFSVVTEDTATKNNFTESSFVIQYHPNGTLKKKYYYLREVQEIIEYWPNGTAKIVADYLACDFYYYCGKYREYDEQGKLAVKGQYNFPNDHLDQPVKIGRWKYYEKGKLKNKEFIVCVR